MYNQDVYKERIIRGLTDITVYTSLSNKAGRFNTNKEAEEFYRGLLNLFYGWELKAMNTEEDPSYEGVDLGYKEQGVAVQVTSENDAEKIHHSIRGFKNKSIKEGYTQLYILMYKGKGDFPRADFAKTVGQSFVFDRAKNIIDHSDLCSMLKDAEFDYIEKIYKYLDTRGILSYAGIDESIDDLDIIDKIFNYIKSNKPQRATTNDNILAASSIDLVPKIELNFPLQQREAVNRLMLKTWDKKRIIQEFISKQIQEDEISINELAYDIQDRYCAIKGTSSPQTTIADISIIKQLALEYLPIHWRTKINYIANAEALVFYFFEFCYIGVKRRNSPGVQGGLF